MRIHRSKWQHVSYVTQFLIAGVATLCVLVPARAQQTAQSSAASGTRACSANPVLTSSGKQKHVPKTKHPPPPDPLPACVEVKAEALEAQEALQSFARDLQWRIHENHATEDTWTFVRYLNSDELEKYADTNVQVQSVDFENGKAAAMVRTTDIGGGFVRVQISAQFKGEGKSTDATMKQPATSWTLHSKGTFEKEMTAALEVRYGHAQ